MKKLSAIILIFLLFSCEKQYEDAIPEGSSIVRSTLYSDLTDDGNIMLQWGDVRICNGFNCIRNEVSASNYELFVKRPGAQNFERVIRLPSGTNQFLFGDVSKGEAYEFFIKSNRAGTSVDSNTVMIIPAEVQEIELVFRLDMSGHALMHPRLSPLGSKVAYVSDVQFTEAGEERRALSLFIWDKEAQQHYLVKRNANQPNWSSDGKRLIYVTTSGLSQSVQGVLPSHLEIFDLEGEEFTLISGGFHQQYLPSFSKDDEQVFFYSDSLNREDFGLWQRDFFGNTSPVFPSFRDPELLAGMSPFYGLDVSQITEMVAVDHLQLFNDRPVYHIFGFDMASGGQKVDLMVSQWSDFSPSFSPVDANKLAFISDRSGISQVWLLDLVSKELKQVTFFSTQKSDYRITKIGSSISWGDDGNSLIFPVSSPRGGRELVKIPL
ncbi:hypothetical protein Belba_3801 [Belliella baltica DSM 15883]|uniref:Periplasmic component of the Tol biopolymer transport system n=1 Tax=Belliella baltica (strain DSM 15883 / CIP 108006 / LMG 21964 / BA134) TaxID=866536 RepID=I3ZAL5_BELBD|nr:PD40 domain-containing protein [Belliella baltica]AFL86283.1 hypothetical protein Belba_3801 [Belliella baltica DSM 15883]